VVLILKMTRKLGVGILHHFWVGAGGFGGVLVSET